MASTIKLKNSTTKGNTPSSLEQGEVAINVNDGNLFYGNGSAVLQNFTFNHITASGNISASGTIIANKIITTQITSSFVTSSTFILTTHITSSGNSIFGNDATDTHTFTGAITASGNISASGTVTANSASLSGRINVSGRSQFGSTSATQTSHQFKGISGDTNVFSLFDKDGDEMININGVIGDNTSNFTIGDIGTAGNGTLIKIEDHNNRTFISNDGKDGFFGINTTTPDKALVVMGNVSSSGTISGTTYNSRGKQVISYASFFNKIQVGTKSDSLPVSINGNITASGNVWVSGSGNNIYLNNNGNITSSGNISASLNSKIFASSASFGGASFLRSFNVKGAGLEGRLSLQGAAGTDNPGIEFTVNDNTSRALIRLDQVGTNGTALEFFTEPDGGDIANTLTIGHTGHITASGNISSSGTIIANEANIIGFITASGKTRFGTTSGTSGISHQFKGISGDATFFTIFDKDGEEVMKGSGAVGDGNLTYAFGDNAVAGNGVFLQIEDGNNRGFFKNDSNNAHFGINTITPGEELEVVGNISASGTLAANSIELGHATDTTIARSSAGVITVEGNTVATTNLALDSFADSTSNSIGVGTIELGHASDTTIARSAAGKATIEGREITTNGSSGTNFITFSTNGYVATSVSNELHLGNSLYGNYHFNWQSVSIEADLDSTTRQITKNEVNCGWPVPVDLAKVEVRVNCRTNGSGNNLKTVLFKTASELTGNANATVLGTAATVTGANQNQFNDMTITDGGAVSAGEVIYVGVGCTNGTPQLRFNITILGYVA